MELEDAIRNIAPEWEREGGQEGLTELVLLRALEQERVGEDSRQRIQELKCRYPNAPQRGAPKPYARNNEAQRARAPISQETQQQMSDAEWLSAMAKYTGQLPAFVGRQFVGGALEISQDLKKLAATNPERFAALANQMDATIPPTYFEAILRGLIDSGDGAGRPGTLEQVCSVLRRIRDLGVSVHGQEIAWATRALAEETLPDDIVQMLCQVALEDPDPQSDHWPVRGDQESPIDQAINSARGAAAVALAQLLFADRSRWSVLEPTIGQLVEDRVLAVRSVAVESLLAILDTQRSDALIYFKRLARDAGPILGTDCVERFFHYAIFRDYPAVRPILIGMLNSADSHVIETAARQIAVAALWVEEARGDEVFVLEMGEHARAGAATVYASNLSDETVGTECEKRLRTLFEDKSDDVRREASRCWVHLEPDQVAFRGSLINAFAHSPASARNVTLLVHRLKDARRPLPSEVCTLAERALEAFGSKAASSQHEEAGFAGELAALMVRLHEQTNDTVIQERILDTFDKMIRLGFYGVDEQLKRQYDR